MTYRRAALAAVLLAAVVWMYAGRDGRGSLARITADGWYYHVYTASLVNDVDLDFTDEYKVTGNWYRFGPTPTGRPGNPFGIGAPLMTVPLYLVGTAIAALTGGDTGGFGAAQIRLVVLASPLFSVGGIFFAWRLCRRRLVDGWPALLGPIAAFAAGPFVYYAVRQPGYAHPQALFFAAWLVDAWDASYDRPRTARTWLGLGALFGAAALARPQLAPWGFLLAIAAADDARRGPVPAAVGCWALGGLAALAVFAPQLVAWKVLYGSMCLRIELLPLPDVDGAPRVAVEAGVEEPPRVLQGGTPGEGQLDHLLVGLSRADDPGVRPHGRAHGLAGLDPLALLDDVRVRLVDDAADLRQGLGAPAPQRPDLLVDETRGRRPGPALRLRARRDLRARLRQAVGLGRRRAWRAGARRALGLRLPLAWHGHASLLDPQPDQVAAVCEVLAER
jgi:hypothetical protein